MSNGGAPRSQYWHPFSDLAETRRAELELVEGDGATIRDAQGRSYLDLTAGLWFANAGHGRVEIAEAMRDQATRLAAYSTFGDLINPPVRELAEQLASMAPIEDAVVFLTSGGSDAVDSAVKIVRRFWDLKGQPDKLVVVSRDAAYHGMHGFGTGLGGIAANRVGYGNMDHPLATTVPTNDASALERQIMSIGPERVAAFFVEPVIGAGGVIAPSPGYLEETMAICRRHDVLYVADEVVTGFGRLGSWFACEHYGVEPDLVLFAKGVTSGYQPLGGLLIAERVWCEFADSSRPTMLRHGYTYSGHAVAAAAALANLAILESEELLTAARERGVQLSRGLDELAGLPGVVETRSAGFLGAVALDIAADAHLPPRVVGHARHAGLLTRVIGGDAIQLSPPFVTTPAQLDRMLELLGESIDAAVGSREVA